MKKYSYFMLAFAAAFMTFSCQEIPEPGTPEETQPAEVKMITVSCTIADPDPTTKVTLTNTGSIGKTEWVNGDQVFFHGAKVGTSGDDIYSYVAAAHDVSGDGKTALFTIPDIAMKFNSTDVGWRDSKYVTDLYAVYPASAVSTFSNGAEWFFISSFKNTNNLLLAGHNDTRVNSGNSFTFINLVGALSFKVNSDGISGGFDSYEVVGNNNETVGYTKYCIKTDRDNTDKNDYRTLYTGSDGPGASSGAQTSIVVSDWDGDDGSTINTVYFPNGVNFTGGFTIKFLKNGDEVRRVSTKTGKNIAVGKYLDLGDITSRMYVYTPPTPHDATTPAIAGAVDLGSSGNANCYVIDGSVDSNKNKAFKFKAVKGNSSLAVGDIESVEVLWETWNNAETVTANSIIAEVDYDKQPAEDDFWVTLKTSSTLHPGNAVIAVKDGSDNILWSWHIWVPATSYSVYTGNAHATNLMSRNLGALVDTEASTTEMIDVRSVGLFYQWGRKDPFVGPRQLDSDYPSGAKIAGTGMTSTGDSISLAQSIANPTLYGKHSGDWCSDHNAEYWGDSGSKSMYDPCPPGYRVPKRVKSGTNLWSDTSLKTTAEWDTAGWEYNGTYHWFTLGTPKAVFPLTGYLDGGTYNRVTSRTCIWNAHAESDDQAYNRYIYYESSNPQGRNYGHAKSKGYIVRCAVE